MCFVVDEDPPDWSVSLTQSQDGRRTDRRETGERQERTRQNITGGKTREDTDHDRGHERDEMIEETWRDNDGGDGTTEDNRERGQDREVKREDRDGDMTRTKQEDQLYLMRTTTNWRHKTRNDRVEDTRQQWDNMKTDKKQMDDMRQKHETTVRTGRRGR